MLCCGNSDGSIAILTILHRTDKIDSIVLHDGVECHMTMHFVPSAIVKLLICTFPMPE